MNRLPEISDAEWFVMRAVWDKHPQTAQEIVAALESAQDWNPRTIKTMLNRLIKKGALGFRTEGKRYLYFPRVKQSECVRAESKSFLKRVFGGALAPMVAHFVDTDELSEADLEELRRLLARKKESRV